jgi:diguanylate cyclase (GGDEF)-like protein
MPILGPLAAVRDDVPADTGPGAAPATVSPVGPAGGRMAPLFSAGAPSSGVHAAARSGGGEPAEVPCGVLSVGEDGHLLHVNAVASRLLGHVDETLVGQPFDGLLTDAARSMYEVGVRPRLDSHGGVDEIHTTLLAADGRHLPVLLRAVRAATRDGTPVTDIAFLPMRHRRSMQTALDEARRAAAAATAQHALAERDLAATRARLADAERRLLRTGGMLQPSPAGGPAHLHDALTGLPSDVLFDDRAVLALAHAARHGRRVALLHLVVEDHQVLVGLHGQAVGDRLMQDVALRLCGALRASDSMSRAGERAFVVMLTDVAQPGHVARVTEKLMALMLRPFESAAGPLRPMLRAGIAMTPDDGDDIAVLRRQAEAAYHEAVLAEDGAFRFRSGALNRRATEQRVMVEALNHALACDEFTLAWQADVSISSGRVCGVEALLRWQHPALGELSPPQFLAAAEDSGLIVPIGAWVLRTACRQARAWMDEGGEKLPVTVNISAAELRDPSFADHVGAALQASGLRPQLLTLELPENVLTHGYDDVQRLLARAVVLGVRVSIDDFGTGPATLAELQHLPVTTLKLDASFVQAAPHDATASAVLEAVIRMARALKRRIVAEGVERKEQAHWLGAHGCALMQGHLFGAARNGDEMTALLRQQWKRPAD